MMLCIVPQYIPASNSTDTALGRLPRGEFLVFFGNGGPSCRAGSCRLVLLRLPLPWPVAWHSNGRVQLVVLVVSDFVQSVEQRGDQLVSQEMWAAAGRACCCCRSDYWCATRLRPQHSSRSKHNLSFLCFLFYIQLMRLHQKLFLFSTSRYC